MVMFPLSTLLLLHYFSGRDEIWSIMNQLQISGGDSTVNAAHRLYEVRHV